MSLQRKTLAEMLTFTRAGTATYFGSDGLLKTAAANEARFDYDPVTLQPRGLLVEGSRTNSIRNNTMQGAASGTPGTMPTNWSTGFNTTTGVSREVVGTGVEGGINYIDVRFFGTAVGAGSFDLFFDGVNSIAALTGQRWSISYFWRLIAGSTTGLSGATNLLYEHTSGTAFVGTTSAGSAIFPTSASLGSQRVRGSGVLSGGATTAFVRPLVKVNIANAATIDITLRIGMPQLELGAYSTSVMPTTTTAVTRAADNVVMTGTQFSDWFNANEGTFAVEFDPITNGLTNTGANDFEYVYDVDSSGAPTSNHILAVSAAYGPGVRAQTELAGVNQAALTSAATLGTGASLRQAYAYKANDFAGSLNGAAVLTDTSGTLPTPDRMAIGSQNAGGSGHFDGHIRRIRYWPNRLSNALLQEATA